MPATPSVRNQASQVPSSGDFAATHWSIVLSVVQGTEKLDAAAAMAELCRIYWYPLFAYVRRRGHESHEAEDLTQEFFVRLLAKDFLRAVDPGKGRFRSFLLAAIKHFLADEWDRSRAQKRGGGQVMISLDGAEARYCQEPSHPLTAERLYERQWAIAVLRQVLGRLRDEARSEGKSLLFKRLEPHLAGDAKTTYAVAAAELGLSENAARKAVHRLRRRFRQLLREEIADTVKSPGEIDEEIQYLLGCL